MITLDLSRQDVDTSNEASHDCGLNACFNPTHIHSSDRKDNSSHTACHLRARQLRRGRGDIPVLCAAHTSRQCLTGSAGLTPWEHAVASWMFLRRHAPFDKIPRDALRSIPSDNPVMNEELRTYEIVRSVSGQVMRLVVAKTLRARVAEVLGS